MTITIPDDLAASLKAEAERQGTSPEELALQGVRQVLPAADAATARGYELDDEMKALLAAKRERMLREAANPPESVSYYANDDWD